jgi:hypothetical protein
MCLEVKQLARKLWVWSLATLTSQSQRCALKFPHAYGLQRQHWSIENTLHWCLDVTFREDENRVRERHAANNLAWLKRFAISLLKQQNDKHSIAMRRRIAGWNVDYLTQVVGLQST